MVQQMRRRTALGAKNDRESRVTNMGPYSDYAQQKRAERIASIMLRVKDPDAKRIWRCHLANLANNETDYNARVAALYGEKTWNRYIGMLLRTS